MADCTPHTNLVRMFRGARVDYVLLIGEGIDNSFDADANTVAIRFDEYTVVISDDGRGIDREHIGSLFTLGEHVPATREALGRFGVGIKAQSVSAGNIFKVSSLSRDGRVRAKINWRTLLESGQWTYADPRWLPYEVGAPTGTRIEITDLQNPPRISAERIRQEIAQRFYPALATGKRIEVNGIAIDPLREPRMTDIIDCTLALSDGRTAHVRGGILAEPSKLSRVHVAYLHRVIMPASPLGTGDYSGINKLFARVQIAGPWHLGTFKDDLPDESEREELENAVERVLEPILKQCHSAAIDARVDGLQLKLNEMLPPDLRMRPRRLSEKAPKPESERERKKRSGLVDADKADIGGPAKSKAEPRGVLQINFDGKAEDHGVGEFLPGSKSTPHRIQLSPGDPYVKQLMEARDQVVATRSLFALALALFEHARETRDPNYQLEIDGSFGKRLARLLGMQASPTLVEKQIQEDS